MINNKPKISVGIPVRNGGKLIERAIECILSQTEKNLEIIISDNCSNDGSEKFLKKITQKNSNIVLYRQVKLLKALDNFKFVLSKARGKFFMWAAHDDTRSNNFIEVLIKSLEDNKSAVLAFPELYIYHNENLSDGKKIAYPFSTKGLNKWQRAKKTAFLQCFSIYGVWKSDVLKSLPIIYCRWWVDLPIMLSASYYGSFVKNKKARFNCLEIVKTSEERSKIEGYSNKFSLFKSVIELVKTTFITCFKVGGVNFAIFSTFLVINKQIINFPGFFLRKFKLTE